MRPIGTPEPSPLIELIQRALDRAIQDDAFETPAGLFCWDCNTQTMHREWDTLRPRWTCDECEMSAPEVTVMTRQPEGTVIPDTPPVRERNTTPFQIGDRVRIIGTREELATIAIHVPVTGMLGTIVQNHGVGTNQWDVRIEQGRTYYFNTDYLEHA